MLMLFCFYQDSTVSPQVSSNEGQRLLVKSSESLSFSFIKKTGIVISNLKLLYRSFSFISLKIYKVTAKFDPELDYGILKMYFKIHILQKLNSCLVFDYSILFYDKLSLKLKITVKKYHKTY